MTLLLNITGDGITFARSCLVPQRILPACVNQHVVRTFGKFNAQTVFYSLYPQTGRGINGFMNASMVIPFGVAHVVPLSFMGAA